MRDGCSGVADDGVRMQCELVYPYQEYLLATEIRVRFDLLCFVCAGQWQRRYDLNELEGMKACFGGATLILGGR